MSITTKESFTTSDYKELDIVASAVKINLSYLETLDPSDYNFPNEIWHTKPSVEIIWKTSLVLPVVLIGITLNTIILATLVRNKWLWSPSNYLIANLALTDLLTLLLCPWMFLISDFYQSYILGNIGCRLEGFTQASILLASVGAVMLVSYDRLAAAVLPAEARVSAKYAPRLAAINWLFAIGLSLPLFIYREYWERQWLNYLEIYCTENIEILPLYWHVIVVALVWLPLSVMAVTYGTIIYRLERCARELSSRGGGVCVVRARSRAMRVSAGVLLTALLCRLPFTCLVYWRNSMLKNMQVNSVEGSFRILWFISHFLIYLNCVLNPLIYGFSNERFRRAMDRTPGIRSCKFGSWCCTCTTKKPDACDKNTKVFLVTASPTTNRNLTRLIKNLLHVHADQHNFTLPRTDKTDVKSSKVTPLEDV